jgi:hypothetical protein
VSRRKSASRTSIRCSAGTYPLAVKIDGHYDREADIACVPFEGNDPKAVLADETAAGRRESLLGTAGALIGTYPPGYLDELRGDWPE